MTEQGNGTVAAAVASPDHIVISVDVETMGPDINVHAFKAAGFVVARLTHHDTNDTKYEVIRTFQQSVKDEFIDPKAIDPACATFWATRVAPEVKQQLNDKGTTPRQAARAILFFLAECDALYADAHVEWMSDYGAFDVPWVNRLLTADADTAAHNKSDDHDSDEKAAASVATEAAAGTTAVAEPDGAAVSAMRTIAPAVCHLAWLNHFVQQHASTLMHGRPNVFHLANRLRFEVNVDSMQVMLSESGRRDLKQHTQTWAQTRQAHQPVDDAERNVMQYVWMLRWKAERDLELAKLRAFVVMHTSLINELMAQQPGQQS